MKKLVFLCLLTALCTSVLIASRNPREPEFVYDTIKSKIAGKKTKEAPLAHHIIRQMYRRRFQRNDGSDVTFHPELYTFLRGQGPNALDAIAMLAQVVEKELQYSQPGRDPGLVRIKAQAFFEWKLEAQRIAEELKGLKNNPFLSDKEKVKKKQELQQELQEIHDDTFNRFDEARKIEKADISIYLNLKRTLRVLDKLGTEIYEDLQRAELKKLFGTEDPSKLPDLPGLPTLPSLPSLPGEVDFTHAVGPAKTVVKTHFCQIKVDQRGKKQVWVRIRHAQILRRGRRTSGPETTVKLDRAQIEDIKRALKIRRKWRKGNLSGFKRKVPGRAPVGGLFIVRPVADFLRAKDQMELSLGSALVAPSSSRPDPNERLINAPKTPFDYRHRGIK